MTCPPGLARRDNLGREPPRRYHGEVLSTCRIKRLPRRAPVNRKTSPRRGACHTSVGCRKMRIAPKGSPRRVDYIAACFLSFRRMSKCSAGGESSVLCASRGNRIRRGAPRRCRRPTVNVRVAHASGRSVTQGLPRFASARPETSVRIAQGSQSTLRLGEGPAMTSARRQS